MQVRSIYAMNFASYNEIYFDMEEHKGLTLIHGATGSGKSTLCDLIPWTLFGKTAKNGNADEVLSWNINGMTKATVDIGNYVVTRTRGARAKDNDLYFQVSGEIDPPRRGKDLNDTQKLINDLIGMDYDLYLSGSYFHEFSQTAQFFTTTAKNRRAICEQLVDLSLAKKLQVNITTDKKTNKYDLVTTEGELASVKIHIQHTENMHDRFIDQSNSWEKEHIAKVRALNEKFENFEDNKSIQLSTLLQHKEREDHETASNIVTVQQHIDALSNTKSPAEYKEWGARLKRLKDNHKFEACPTCGGDKDHKFLDLLAKEESEYNDKRLDDAYKWKDLEQYKRNLVELKREDKSYADVYKEVVNRENTYGEQLDAELEKENPHLSEIETSLNIVEGWYDKEDSLVFKVDQLKQKQSDLELLSDIIENFRSEVVKNTIMNIEDRANELLSAHFDAEIKIALDVTDADKVEVSIFKDGNTASFTQLSKGQRQLLKLSFGMAVMQAVASHNSVKFNQITIDEGLDGLDDNMKLKAVNMLNSLVNEYDSIFLVEHSETVKAMIENKIEVQLINGHSEITKNE